MLIKPHLEKTFAFGALNPASLSNRKCKFVPKKWVSFFSLFQVLEPRFNVETMALLLNIPPNKTLLRRHLATHFNLLVGSEAQQHKQECLENPDYILLTATAKVKV